MLLSNHAVVIAGAGPTGLMLAGELALAGVDVAIVERRPDQTLAGSRAGGLHARTLEILDQRGIVDRFFAEGQKAQVTGFAGVMFDLIGFPTRHPYGLGLWQNHIERILAGWVDELHVTIYPGCEVTGFTQDESGVAITLSDGDTLQAQYLVGCDGGRSLVRKLAGIHFPGSDATTSSLIGEVEWADTPPLGVHRNAFGLHSFGRVDYTIRDGQIIYAETGPIRFLVSQATVGSSGDATLAELKSALIAACGTDYGAHSPTWISRFTDATRQAETYRRGRVLLAGDSAHIHAPDGGQGLQMGVQDAVNLGWKLAQVIKGISPDSLLDTYHAERHPVAAKLLRTTMASVALRRDDDRVNALRATMTDFLAMDEPRRSMAALLSGLDVHYDLGNGHPLLGRRMPDLDLHTADGPRRVYSLLHQAKPVLLNLGLPGRMTIAPWSDRVQLFDATTAGPWDLPVPGMVPAPGAVLIRPDGHVAWVGDGTDSCLTEALTTWFGPAR